MNVKVNKTKSKNHISMSKFLSFLQLFPGPLQIVVQEDKIENEDQLRHVLAEHEYASVRMVVKLSGVDTIRVFSFSESQ